MHPRWLNRGVAGIGVASFFSDVSHEVPTALLPALLTTTLGAPEAAPVLAAIALARRDPATARGHARRAVERNPDSRAGWMLLARTENAGLLDGVGENLATDSLIA